MSMFFVSMECPSDTGYRSPKEAKEVYNSWLFKLFDYDFKFLSFCKLPYMLSTVMIFLPAMQCLAPAGALCCPGWMRLVVLLPWETTVRLRSSWRALLPMHKRTTGIYRRVPKGKKQKHEETIMDHGWLRNPAPVKVPCKHPLKNLIIYL